MESLPLFPLGTVLLPGVRFPLRVFEPRYVAMVRHLESTTAREFGVVAIRRGHEVGSHIPELYRIGCAAVLKNVTRAEGHLVIEAACSRRFRIESVDEGGAPYLVASVEWLDLQAEDVAVEATNGARRAFESFSRAVGAHVQGLPQDPGRLTASVLDGLGLPLPERQKVLEAGDATARLRAVTRLCHREEGLAEVLHCRAATATPSSRLSPN